MLNALYVRTPHERRGAAATAVARGGNDSTLDDAFFHHCLFARRWFESRLAGSLPERSSPLIGFFDHDHSLREAINHSVHSLRGIHLYLQCNFEREIRKFCFRGFRETVGEFWHSIFSHDYLSSLIGDRWLRAKLRASGKHRHERSAD